MFSVEMSFKFCYIHLFTAQFDEKNGFVLSICKAKLFRVWKYCGPLGKE